MIHDPRDPWPQRFNLTLAVAVLLGVPWLLLIINTNWKWPS